MDTDKIVVRNRLTALEAYLKCEEFGLSLATGFQQGYFSFDEWGWTIYDIQQVISEQNKDAFQPLLDQARSKRVRVGDIKVKGSKVIYYALHDDALKNGTFLKSSKYGVSRYINGDYCGLYNKEDKINLMELKQYSRNQAKYILPQCCGGE